MRMFHGSGDLRQFNASIAGFVASSLPSMFAVIKSLVSSFQISSRLESAVLFCWTLSKIIAPFFESFCLQGYVSGAAAAELPSCKAQNIAETPTRNKQEISPGKAELLRNNRISFLPPEHYPMHHSPKMRVMFIFAAATNAEISQVFFLSERQG